MWFYNKNVYFWCFCFVFVGEHGFSQQWIEVVTWLIQKLLTTGPNVMEISNVNNYVKLTELV